MHFVLDRPTGNLAIPMYTSCMKRQSRFNGTKPSKCTTLRDVWNIRNYTKLLKHRFFHVSHDFLAQHLRETFCTVLVPKLCRFYTYIHTYIHFILLKQDNKHSGTHLGELDGIVHRRTLGCLGGAVVERWTRDRKVTGSIPGSGAIKSTRSTQPSIPPR